MKVKWIIFNTALYVLLTSASSCNVGLTAIKGNKNYITRDFKVKGFDKIHSSVVADIIYTQSTDDTTSLSIYGSDNLVELVDVEIKGSTLHLDMKKKNIKNGDLKITISSPNLTQIKASGVTNFTIREQLTTPSLKIDTDGVGNMKIESITCTDIEVSSSGVGGVYIEGNADNATISTQGVGNINASLLVTKNTDARANGVGSISCHATESIYARVNGVGSISYQGNPEKKDLKKNGVGSINQK